MGVAWAAGNEACKAEAEGDRAGLGVMLGALGTCSCAWYGGLDRNRRKPNAMGRLLRWKDFHVLAAWQPPTRQKCVRLDSGRS